LKGIKKTKRLYNIGAERGTIPRLLLGKFKCNTIKKKKINNQEGLSQVLEVLCSTEVLVGDGGTLLHLSICQEL